MGTGGIAYCKTTGVCRGKVLRVYSGDVTTGEPLLVGGVDIAVVDTSEGEKRMYVDMLRIDAQEATA